MDLNELFKYGTCGIKNILYTDNNITNRNINHIDIYRTHVIVVGCGGTGGRLIPLLAQHIKNHNFTFETIFNNNLYLQHKMKLILVDADTVENKNLKRQNFFSFDVGRGKAEVMAERFGALYGMDIKYHNDFWNSEMLVGGTNYIIFDCTDNRKARKSIEESALNQSSANTVLISCGNEDDFGQVLVSQSKTTYYGIDRKKDLIDQFVILDEMIKDPNPTRKVLIESVPTLLELFRDFKDSEKPSCTDITLIDDQSMPINTLVGQLAYNAFYMLVAGKSLNYHMVKCNINNTYSTNMITFPKDARSLLVKGIYGDSSPSAINALADFTSTDIYSIDVDGIIELFNKHDRKYTEMFYNKFISNNYRFGKTEENFSRLSWRK